MGERDVIDRTGDSPVTTDEIVRDLGTLGIRNGEVLLVHSSLSALGWVCGGPVAVIDALRSLLGNEGTLVMPAHSTSLGEPSYWKNPPVPESWYSAIREHTSPYDPTVTPTRMMGSVAEAFRRKPGVLRSGHPRFSFAACGHRAIEIIEPHPLAHGLGESSPLARLYELGARVLLLGVGHDSNTSLHLSEHRAQWSGRRIIMQGAPMQVGRERRWLEFEELEGDASDFGDIGAAFADRVLSGNVGRGQALLMAQRELVDFGASWIALHRTS